MKVVVLTLYIILLFFLSCRWFTMDPTDNKLVVLNQADYNIMVLINYEYPDTSFFQSRPAGTVQAKQKRGLPYIGDWEELLREKKVLTIFFVPTDSINKKIDKEKLPAILRKLKPEKKLLLSKPQLDSLNWTIKFP